MAAAHIDYSKGELSVWVPEHVETLAPQELRSDPFSLEKPYGVWEATCECFDGHLRRDPSRIILADTGRNREDPSVGRVKARWFSADSANGYENQPICAYITGQETSSEAYDSLLHEAWVWPRTLIFTSNQSGHSLEPAAHLAVGSELLKEFTERLESVLVGVFGDTSFMIWSRNGRL